MYIVSHSLQYSGTRWWFLFVFLGFRQPSFICVRGSRVLVLDAFALMRHISVCRHVYIFCLRLCVSEYVMPLPLRWLRLTTSPAIKPVSIVCRARVPLSSYVSSLVVTRHSAVMLWLRVSPPRTLCIYALSYAVRRPASAMWIGLP